MRTECESRRTVFSLPRRLSDCGIVDKSQRVLFPALKGKWHLPSPASEQEPDGTLHGEASRKSMELYRHVQPPHSHPVLPAEVPPILQGHLHLGELGSRQEMKAWAVSIEGSPDSAVGKIHEARAMSPFNQGLRCAGGSPTLMCHEPEVL